MLNKETNLTVNDYKLLLDYGKSLNPFDIDFRKKAIETLISLFHFEGAAFPLVDKKGYYRDLVYANFSPLSIEAYETVCYEHDFFAPANQSKIDTKDVFTIEDFKTYGEYEASSLYNQCLFHNNFYYEALVLLRNEQSEAIGAVAVYHDKSYHGFTEKERELLNEIGKMIEKACLIHLSYFNANHNIALMHNALFRMPVGMLLCDSDFNILEMNREINRILEISGQEVSLFSARNLLVNQVLPVYQRTGLNTFTLDSIPVMEVLIEHLILNDALHKNFNTNYAIYITCRTENGSTGWLEYLTLKGLTKRESEITELLRQGKIPAEISEVLHISINTVKRHKENIYKKLEISRIHQLHNLYNKSLIKPLQQTNSSLCM